MESYVIKKTPFWMLEAVESILDVENIRIQEVIDNSLKFGMQDTQMKEYLKKLIEFKQRVTNDNLAILEKYPILKPYFVMTEFEKEDISLVTSLVNSNRDRLAGELSATDVDKIIHSLITDILEHNNRYLVTEEQEISSVAEVINILRGLESDDAFKMRMIELYSDRYMILEELQRFLVKASEVVKKHFPIIKKDFEDYVERMKEKEVFYKYIKDNKVLRMDLETACEVQPSIICFNQMTIISRDNGKYFFIGIYSGDLLREKNKNEFNDVQLTVDLKAVGDATRLKILHLLSSQELYLQEIADHLKLTPATVSHHINILLQSQMVCITVNVEKAKKVYYGLNPVKLTELGEAIKGLAVSS